MFDPNPELPTDNYGSWRAMNLDLRARKAVQNYEKLKSSEPGEGVQFRSTKGNDDDESGVCSPPLWKTSPTTNPPRGQYRHLSPPSRAQAIARGQWELMEMVKNMPESSYELSLKDLVESVPGQEMDSASTTTTTQEECLAAGISNPGLKHRQGSKRIVRAAGRNGGVEEKGVFLKMVFPVSVGSRKKKTTIVNGKVNGKISPKPAEEGKSMEEKEYWWKKRFSASTVESESSYSRGSSSSRSSSSRSNSSRSNSGRKGSVLLPNCWPFINTKKKQA